MAKRKLTIIDKPEGYDFPKLSNDLMGEKEKVLNRRIKQVDLEEINGVDDLVAAYGHASIQARNIGGCAEVYESM